jgi:hypothetical protein
LNAFRVILHYVTAPFRLLLRGPTYLISAPRKIWGMRPPLRAAVLLEAFLLICTIVVGVDYLVREGVANVGQRREIIWIATMLALLITTPLAAYHLVRLWLEGEPSRYPDIDRAWDAGIAALAEQGLELADLPLYIVLGVGAESEATAMMAASRLTTPVSGMPRGPAPLRWYATEKAIYLVCTGLGRLGRLSELAAASAPPARGGAPVGNPIAATMVAGVSPHQSFPPRGFPTDATEAGGGQILGTLVAGGPAGGDGGQTSAAPTSSGMSRKDADEQTDRLDYVMRRLRRARQPYCANNGVLAALPHNVLADVVYAREVPEAVRADLGSVRGAGKIASPVTMLVTGMESEPGFTELVRRVGAERARSSRFGKGFDVWNVASDENLDALSLHACGSFEDFVYALFASDEGAEPRSNGKLYAMLCSVRRHLQPRLRGVLVNGFAIESENSGDPPRLFSGCYFAATGRQGDQQAFVRSVFDKIDQLSEDLQWSDDALREESAYRSVFWLLSAVNVALLAGIVFLVIRLLST